MIITHSTLTRTILLAISAFGMQGCIPRYSNHTVGNGNITTISYQADWRAATIVYKPSTDAKIMTAIQTRLNKIAIIDEQLAAAAAQDKEGKIARRARLLDEIAGITRATSTPYVLAEPPPQMANEFTFNLKGSVDKVQIAQLDFGSTAAKMFEVSGYNLAIRDALYRLNEATFQGAISAEKYPDMFEKVLTAATTMSKHESDASIAKAKAMQDLEKKKQEAVAATRKIDELQAKVTLAEAKLVAAKADNSASPVEKKKAVDRAEEEVVKAKADLDVAKAAQRVLVIQATNVMAKALAEFPELSQKIIEENKNTPISAPAP